MKDQLFLFTGENTFALTEELSRWKRGFIDKHGEANFQVLEGKTLQWKDILEEIRTSPFLGEKRLILVEGLPAKVDKENWESLKDVIHPATILAIVESAPDKRKSTTKFLLKNATVKSFPVQTPKQLVGWLQEVARANGSSIDAPVAAHLVAVVGNDQWHLKNELLKVIAYANNNVIPSSPVSRSEGSSRDVSRDTSSGPSINDVNTVCLPSQKHTVWKMSDLIGKGQRAESVQFARTLHESGEDAFALWNIFLWVAKNIATLWIYKNGKGDTRESGVPFPSAQALMPLVNKMTKEDITRFVASVAEADEAVKTGKIKASTGVQVEMCALLERELLGIGTSNTSSAG